MKRMLVLLSTILVYALSPAPAAAQGISLGAKLGLNVADLGGDDGYADSRTGFAGGAQLVYQFNEWFALQPEVFYAEKGAKPRWLDDTTLKLNYMEVPILARVNLPMASASSLQPHLYAGPAFSFRLSCRAAFDEDDEEIDCDDIPGEPFRAKDNDVGLVLGGGLDFLMARGAFTIEGRYTMGLNSIDDTGGDFDVKNRAFTVLVGLSVPLL